MNVWQLCVLGRGGGDYFWTISPRRQHGSAKTRFWAGLDPGRLDDPPVGCRTFSSARISGAGNASKTNEDRKSKQSEILVNPKIPLK